MGQLALEMGVDSPINCVSVMPGPTRGPEQRQLVKPEFEEAPTAATT